MSDQHSNALTEDEFAAYWNEWSELIVAFGGSEAELDQLKLEKEIGEKKFFNEEINSENVDLIEIINAFALFAFKCKNYSETCLYLTQGLRLPDLPSEEVATL